MDSSFDYTLIIDYEKCSIKELHEILSLLYTSSLECRKDIVEMADYMIYLINEISYDLKDKKHRVLISFIHNLFNVLKKIGATYHIKVIRDNFNEYIKGEPFSPPIESPKSPYEEKPPKIMRKVKKAIIGRD